MVRANITTQETIDTTNDSIVVSKMLETIPGGKTLDVTGWPHETIPGGHPIIKDDDGEYKPLALNAEGTEIDETKASKTVGILISTILTSKPIAAIMVRGSVNVEAAVYAIPAAAKNPLSLIRFWSE